MFDPEREQLEAEIARLQAIVEAQAALIAELRSRVEELESRLGKTPLIYRCRRLVIAPIGVPAVQRKPRSAGRPTKP